MFMSQNHHSVVILGHINIKNKPDRSYSFGIYLFLSYQSSCDFFGEHLKAFFPLYIFGHVKIVFTKQEGLYLHLILTVFLSCIFLLQGWQYIKIFKCMK